MIHNVTITWDDEEYDEAPTWEDFLKEYILDEMHGFIEEMDLSEKTINHAHGVLDKVVKHLNRCIKTQPLNEHTVIRCKDCKHRVPDENGNARICNHPNNNAWNISDMHYCGYAEHRGEE